MTRNRDINDHIVVNGMTFYSYHGVTAEERTLGQRFIVDMSVETDLRPAGRSDALKDTVNYTDLYKTVKAIVENEQYNLLEALAEATAQQILSLFNVSSIWVRVKKPTPPIKDALLNWVAVDVYREKKT